MQMRRWLRCVCRFALGALALLVVPCSLAHAEDAAGDVPGQLRFIRMGVQTIVVDEVGNAILYEDSTPPQVVCEETDAACWRFEANAGTEVVVGGGGDVIGVFEAESESQRK